MDTAHPPAPPGDEAVRFHLFIAGETPRSQRAIENLHRIVRETPGWRCEIEVTDVLAYPERGVAWVATRHPERPVREGGDAGVIARFELPADD